MYGGVSEVGYSLFKHSRQKGRLPESICIEVIWT